MRYIIHYDVAAIFISVIVCIHYYLRRTIKTRQSIIFAIMIFMSIFSNIFDFITIYTISHAGCVPRWADYILNETYLLAFATIPAVYFVYALLLTNNMCVGRNNYGRIFIPYMVIAFLTLTTDYTRLVFYFDENRVYMHGNGLIILYLCAIYYVLSSLYRTIKYRNKLSKGQTLAILFFTVINLCAIFLQIFYENLLIVQFTISIAVLLIYLTMENPENYTDKYLGTYNKHAFAEVFISNVGKKHKFSLLGIKVEGLKYINENLGADSGNHFIKDIAANLKEIAGKRSVFYMSNVSFIIMGEFSEDKWKQILDNIQSRFDKTFAFGDIEISLTVKMCMLTYPDTVKNLDDVVDMFEYSLGKLKKSKNETIIYADKEFLEKGKRENKILQLLSQAVREDGFEVFYQPIYSVKQKKFTTAEALVRLNNTEIGYISSEEFVPIAEKNGYIFAIGDKVIQSVCAFYKNNKLEEYGIEHIHVNLSVIECMHEHLYEKLLQTMEACDIPHGRISFEITETAAIASQDILMNNMNKLIEKGIRFSMDDYGSGFSNTYTIFNYPFSEIKIDKSMLWAAMKDEKALLALKYSIAMIKALKLDIVVEGVETQEQADLLAGMGCDYFQGYLYSSPVSENEFLKLIQ